MERKYRVYIAGPLNAADASGYLKNVHRMIERASTVYKAGFSVYVPAFDLLMGTTTGEWDYNDYIANSLEWLKVSDAVLIDMNDWISRGVATEMKAAMEHGIKVFLSLDDLIRGFEEG